MKKYVVTYSAPVSTEKAAQIQAGIAASLGVPAADVVVIFGAASFAVVDVAEPNVVAAKED